MSRNAKLSAHANITCSSHWLFLSCKSHESESKKFAKTQRCNADETFAIN